MSNKTKQKKDDDFMRDECGSVKTKRKLKSDVSVQPSKKLKQITSDGVSVKVGSEEFVWGDSLSEMEESTSDLKKQDWDTLKKRMDEKGFLFFRGFFPSDMCMAAREKMLNYAKKAKIIKAKDFMKAPIGSSNAGFHVDAYSGTNSVGDNDEKAWEEIGNSDELLNIYNGQHLKELLENLFGDINMLPRQTWVRLMPKEGATVEHADYYYFRKDTQIFEEADEAPGKVKPKFVLKARVKSENCEKCKKSASKGIRQCTLCGTRYHLKCLTSAEKNLAKKPHIWTKGAWHCVECANKKLDFYTIWTCLSEMTYDNSALAVCPKTHLLKKFHLPPKNRQVPTDYKPKTAKWQIPSKLQPGDIVVFNIKTIHASSANTTDFYRFSVDTRVQVKSGIEMLDD